MTWFTLFSSWQFWVAIVINSIFCTMFGSLLPAFMAFNNLDEDNDVVGPCDLSLELLNLQEEAKRLQAEGEALRVVNEDLQKQLDALNPGYANDATELRQGFDKAVY